MAQKLATWCVPDLLCVLDTFKNTVDCYKRDMAKMSCKMHQIS